MRNQYRWLLYLYPQVWRARYGEEFLALLEACPFSVWMLWDICLGAIDAHLHLEVVMGRSFGVMNRLRTTEVMVFCAYIGLAVAGLAFGKMVEYDDFQALLSSNTGVAITYWTLYGGALAALLAVLVGGLPLAYAAVRYAVTTKRWGLLSLFAVPPISLAVWLGYLFLIIALQLANNNLLATPLLLQVVVVGLFAGLFGLAAITSTAAVSLAILQSTISEKLFRFARIPAVLTALAMVVMVVAVLVYGLLARAANPPLFAGDNGVLATNTTLSWLAILATMALATAVAVAALIWGSWSGSGAPRSQALTSQRAS
jgi:hypothetical protein